MKEVFQFVIAVLDELVDIFKYSQEVAKGQPSNPEEEQRLTARLMRKASDEAMRRELGQ